MFAGRIIFRQCVKPTTNALLTAQTSKLGIGETARLYSRGNETVWKSTRARNAGAYIQNALKSRTQSEKIDKIFGVGQAFVAGGAVLGVGALCYYGLGLSDESGIIENSRLWPQEVKSRVASTYSYFGASILLTAGSCVAAFRTPAIMRFMMKNNLVAFAGSVAALMASQTLVRSIAYEPGLNAKHLAWVLNTAVVGAVIAPVCLLGGPLLIKAAWYTCGIVGALSAVAVCAPSDKFLSMGGPLACACGAMFAAGVGSWFLPPTTVMGAGLHSFFLYGGLLIVSGIMLFETQRLVRVAECDPYFYKFDPINESLGIYMSTINIFIRIAMMLAGSQGKRK